MRWDVQRKQKKPSHVQVDNMNEVEEFWKHVESNYLSFVGSS